MDARLHGVGNACAEFGRGAANGAANGVEGGARGITRRALLGGIAGLVACASVPGWARAAGAAGPDGSGASAASATVSQAVSATPGVPAEFVDDLGRTVAVESIERVVACMGSFAKVWELAGGSLVGVTDDALADYPELDLPSDVGVVGDFSELNLEAIAALEPTLVLLSAASGGRGKGGSQADLADSFDELGIPAAYFRVTVFDDYLRMLRRCCSLTGRADLYERNGTEVGDRIEEILAQVPTDSAGSGSPLVAAMIMYSGGARLQDSVTLVGAMLADLGATNVADQDPSLLRDYSTESLLACDPDFVFVIPLGDDGEAARRALERQTADDPAWGALTAVSEGRFYTLDPALFQYKPLERWDESYRVLWGYLYGDGEDAAAAPDSAGQSDADR